MAIKRIFYEKSIHLPPVLKSLDWDGFWDYTGWQDDRGTLSIELISRFKKLLEASTGYTDDNPPEGQDEKTITCGSVAFNVVSTRGTKRPRYGEIYHEFGDFVKGLQAGYDKKTLRKGYRAIQVEGNKLLYIKLEMLLEKLQDDVATMISEKEGVSHSISLIKPAELIEKTPEIITVVSGTDYGAMTEYNARMYQEANNLHEKGDVNTGFSQKKEARERFKKILLDDSFNRLGGKPDEKVEVPYPFEGIKFLHDIKPKSTPSYESMINSFLKPVPKQLKRGGKVGDFMIAAALKPEGLANRLRERGLWDDAIIEPLMAEGLANRLREKGIWDEKFQQTYDPRIIDGEVYVLISGPEKRLEFFKDKSTSTSYDQHVSVKKRR